jgi:Peptidase family M13
MNLAIDSMAALLGDAVGRLYVERHFPAEARARVETMIEGLVAALKEDAAGVAWMAPETRQRALQKLANYDAPVAATLDLLPPPPKKGPSVRKPAIGSGAMAVARTTGARCSRSGSWRRSARR